MARRGNRSGSRFAKPGAAANSDRRSGGKSSEFGPTRNVNTFGGGGSTTASPNARLSGSARKEAPFNGSNVYGILAGGSSSRNAGGSAPNAQKGNKTFGTGSARPGTNPSAPRRSGRRGR